MSRSRQQRKRVYHRASAIARDIRTADFPDAVNIVARLIAGPMTRRRQPATLTITTNTLKDEPLSDEERELFRRANPGLVIAGDKGPEVAVERIEISDKDSKFLESQRWVSCDPNCSQFRACWPSCCKIIDDSCENPPRIARGVRMDDVFEPVGPDSFGGEDGMHSPSAATIRAELEQRKERKS